jgi:CO dehydrogenase/acetyl-CoA synthase beta subunit
MRVKLDQAKLPFLGRSIATGTITVLGPALFKLESQDGFKQLLKQTEYDAILKFNKQPGPAREEAPEPATPAQEPQEDSADNLASGHSIAELRSIAKRIGLKFRLRDTKHELAKMILDHKKEE